MGLTWRSCVFILMNEGLSAKELHLIQLIGPDSQSQRRLAESAGFSLGMTNILLKKLVSKGYIKVVHLNGRTLRYILTPRGFKEKLRRTHHFLRDSIRRIRIFQKNLQELLEGELREGSALCVLGSGEVFEMTIELLSEWGLSYRILSEEDLPALVASSEPVLLLLARPEPGIPEAVSGAESFEKSLRAFDVAALAE